METRLDRTDWPPDALCHPVQRQVCPVMQQDHDPNVVCQHRHRPDDLIAIEDPSERVAGAFGGCSVVHRDQPDPAPLPQAIATDVDEDAIEPCLEASGVA
jgi:hypothetical protein